MEILIFGTTAFPGFILLLFVVGFYFGEEFHRVHRHSKFSVKTVGQEVKREIYGWSDGGQEVMEGGKSMQGMRV